MNITISRLRENIYNIIDSVIDTGIPVFIQRKGKTVKITIEGKVDKLENSKGSEKRKIIQGDPDDLIHVDWSSEWKSDL